MVGNIPEDKFAAYAELLLPLFLDERTVFIVSSDFCHWGFEYDYSFKFEDEPLIYKSVERLDKLGMDHIESHDFNAFTQYLNDFGNSICGRHSIQLLLALIEKAKG